MMTGSATSSPLSAAGPRLECRGMHIDLSAEQRALQAELREYFAALMTPERRAGLDGGEAGGEAYREIVRQMGRDGWLGIGWPQEYGGQGRSALEQYVFYDEANRAGVPMPLVTLNTVGPTLTRVRLRGAEAGVPPEDPRRRDPLRHRLHRAGCRHRPRVVEHPRRPRRRRVRDQRPEGLHHRRPRRRLSSGSRAAPIPKRRSTRASRSSSCPPTSPGFKHTPIWTLGGGHTNATYYEDVRVPVTNLVGEENAGWKLITQPAQPRARRAGSGRQDRPPAPGGAGVGEGDDARRRHAA